MPTMHDTTGDMSRDLSRDTTPPDRPHDTTRRDSVSVNDAARVLGITPDAVRARLRRGVLAGEKIGTSWYVFLPDVDIDASPPGRDTTRRDATHQSSRDTTAHDTTDDRDELLAELRRDKAYLQGLLDRTVAQLEAERQRADVLQLRAIGTGETPRETAPEPPGRPESGEKGLHGVLAWVRRLWR